MMAPSEGATPSLNTMKLIIIRGVPGSGKTTLAQQIAPNHYHEADQYMVDTHGNYHFDPKRLGPAHAACKQAVLSDMEGNVDTIVVSNTFVRRWEFEPYIEMALDHGYDVEVIVADGAFESVHGVPASKVLDMQARWES